MHKQTHARTWAHTDNDKGHMEACYISGRPSRENPRANLLYSLGWPIRPSLRSLRAATSLRATPLRPGTSQSAATS